MKDRRATPATVTLNMRLIDPVWRMHSAWEMKVVSRQVMKSRLRGMARQRERNGRWSLQKYIETY